VSLANKAFSIFQRDLLLFVTNLATGIIVARTLGPAALGIWVILSMVPSYAEALGRTKTDVAAVYFVGKKLFRREDLLFNLNLIALASAGMILAIILWQFGPIYVWLFKNEAGDYKTEVLVLMMQIPLQFLYLNYSYFHIAEENVYAYNRMVVIHAWANSLTAITLLTLTSLGLWSVILGALTGTALALLFGWRSIERKSWVSGRASKQVSFSMMRYAAHFYVGGVLGQLQQSGTSLLAVAYLVPAQMAFLAQGQSVGKLLHKVVDPVSTILFPRISRSGEDAAVGTSCAAFRLSSILLMAGGLALAIVAEPLIVLLYGPAFQPTAAVVHYLLPGLVIGGTCGTLHSYFTGTGRARLIPRIQFLPLVIQLFLAWLFLQWWGLTGAATAISAGLALYGLALFIVFVRVSKASVTELVPGIADLRYLVVFGANRISVFLKSIGYDLNMSVIDVLKKVVPKSLRAQSWVQKLRTRVVFHATLAGHLKRQLSFAEDRETAKTFLGKRVLVPIIETSHYQHQHMLAIAKALQLRGAEVKVLICGEVLNGCEIKSVRKEGDKDPCWSCRFHARHTTPLFGLETVTLADFVSASEREQIREAATEQVSRGESIQSHGIFLDQSVSDSVTRYYYGAVPIEAEPVATVRQAHTMSALFTAEVAHRIDQQWHPDIVLCNMSCYSTWEAFYKYYRNRDERFRLISLTQFNLNALTFNQFELFGNCKRFFEYQEARSGQALTSSERAELSHFIIERHSGQAAIFQSLGFFESNNQLIMNPQLQFDKNKRNIFIFSNIYWDIGLSENSGLYKDVVAWVLGTIDLLKDKPAAHLYIKPHPGEVFDTASSLKGISQIIREKYPNLPNNVTIIEPNWKIKTYDLFPYIDLGVIFTGTLGLEMMLAGIPVVSTGTTTHHGLGFAAEPTAETEYLALLLGETEPPKYSKEDLELFAYFYFIRTKMPWTLTKQAYGDHFDGFAFESLDELLPGKDPQLDHLCNCIMELKHTVVEAWPSTAPQEIQTS
jgi:O-antigen/teichoic acid export membrane protein